MDFKSATGKTIQEAFEDFDKNNPKVYQLFKEQVLKAIAKGKDRISPKYIINWLRWEIFIKTDDAIEIEIEGEKLMFKINDAYSSRYARKFIDEFPIHEAKIARRRLRVR